MSKLILRDDFSKVYESPTRKYKRTLFKGISHKSDKIEENSKENLDLDDSYKNLKPSVVNKSIFTENSDIEKFVLNDNKSSILNSKLKFNKTVRFSENNTLKTDPNKRKISNFYNLIPKVNNITFSEQINISSLLDIKRKKIKFCLILQTILNCISIGFIVIDNEVENDIDIDYGDHSYIISTLRCLNLFITVVLYVLIYLKARYKNKIFKLTYSMNINKGYKYSELFMIFFELVISSLIIPPFFENILHRDFHNFKRIVSVLSFLKIYCLKDQILLFSPFQYKKARFLRSLLNLEPSGTSLLQSWFQENKYICLISFPFIFFPGISYLLLLAERAPDKDYILDAGYCATSENYFNFIWITGVSFFTSN
jgi:hypothetical protein